MMLEDAAALYSCAVQFFAYAATLYRVTAYRSQMQGSTALATFETACSERCAVAETTSAKHGPSSAAAVRRELARDTLTARQLQVAGLVAHGWSNSEIAESLVVTRGTAANHIAQILRRLGVRRRAEIALWAMRHGLLDATV